MYHSTVVKYLRLTLTMLNINIKSAMEYRTSFFVQIIAMIISNASWAIMWGIFFKRFPSVNGWTFQDTMLLMSLSSINTGLYTLFASGTLSLAKNVASGNVDYFLTLPQNLLWQISLSKLNIASFGDLAFGIIIYFFAGPMTSLQLCSFILMALLTAIIMFNFIVITQSIGFFVSNFEDAADQLFIILLFGTYTPQGGIHGALKVIMMTFIPVLLIGAVPVKLIREFNWTSLAVIFGACIISTIIALFVFKQGLKRYESGNMINVKM